MNESITARHLVAVARDAGVQLSFGERRRAVGAYRALAKIVATSTGPAPLSAGPPSPHWLIEQP